MAYSGPMKDSTSIGFVVVADQRHSRRDHDRVPEALDTLSSISRMRLPFERTAGDEIQGFSHHGRPVVDVVMMLTRLGGWRVGIGVGCVETPLPTSTRQARGSAYIAARQAINEARTSPTDLALVLATDTVSADLYRERVRITRHAEASLWLLRSLLSRRSPEGWEMSDLLNAGLTNQQAAAQLDISASAASQRAKAAAIAITEPGADLASALLSSISREEL